MLHYIMNAIKTKSAILNKNLKERFKRKVYMYTNVLRPVSTEKKKKSAHALSLKKKKKKKDDLPMPNIIRQPLGQLNKLKKNL